MDLGGEPSRGAVGTRPGTRASRGAWLLASLVEKEARKEAWQEAEIERLQQEIERLRGQSLQGGGVKWGAGAAALEQEGASTFWPLY